MDEKTEELRDIFMDVSEEGTVTESQAEGRGSLTDVDEDAIDERIRSVVADMRERYTFETDLDAEAYLAIVRRFYEGEDDAAIAAALDCDPETVFHARMDLHLLGETDTDAPVDLSVLVDAEDAETETLATALDEDPDTIARYRRVAVAQNAARRASHRFQTAFEDVLTDADLTARLTADVQDDGLRDATEDIETNVSF